MYNKLNKHKGDQMNKSQIKEVKSKLNKRIEATFSDVIKREIYDAIDKEKVNCVEVDRITHKPTKLYSLLWDLLYAPQIHTMKSQLKKAVKVGELGEKEISEKYIALLNSFVNECEEVSSLTPTPKIVKETPIEELIKRQAKKDEFSKFASFNKSIGNAHILEDDSLYINGDIFKLEERAEVGIKLGAGDRVHFAEAFTSKDKEGEVHVYVSRNDQFWRSTEVSIVDLWTRIPNNLKSEV